MHFEVAPKVTAAEIKKFVTKRRVKADGSVPIGGGLHSNAASLLEGDI
jgi:hypothetical protein